MPETLKRRELFVAGASLIFLSGCDNPQSNTKGSESTPPTPEKKIKYFEIKWVGLTPKEGSTIGTNFKLEAQVQSVIPGVTLDHLNITTPKATAFPDKVAPDNREHIKEAGNSVILASLKPDENGIVTFTVDAIKFGIPMNTGMEIPFGSDGWGYQDGKEVHTLSPEGERHLIIDSTKQNSS